MSMCHNASSGATATSNALCVRPCYLCGIGPAHIVSNVFIVNIILMFNHILCDNYSVVCLGLCYFIKKQLTSLYRLRQQLFTKWKALCWANITEVPQGCIS